MLNLRYFTQPDILLKIGCRRLARLLKPFTLELMPHNLPQPPPGDEEDTIYPPALAAALAAARTLPSAVAKALLTIEAAAAPENQGALNEIIFRRLPNVGVSHNCPLDCALEVWIVAPEELSPFAPAEQPPITEPAPTPASLDHPYTSPASTSPHAPTLSPSHAPRSTDDPDAATFLHLAKLSPAEYDRVRHSEAKRLRIRVTTLDNEVARVRTELEVQTNALNLPKVEPWPEPVRDIGPVLSAVSERVSLYLVLPDGAPDASALWSGHTHAYQAFHQSPRLNLRSPAGGCGKTTTLDVLATLCACPLRTESLSAAVLFRLVDRYHPTLLLDEVDAYLHQSEELRGLLNAGHKRGACAMRCEGETVRAFKAFAPAALAGLGPLSGTLHDRSIVIPLREAPEGAIRKRFDPLDTGFETELASKLARWAKDNLDALAACQPPLPPGVFNRLADNWRPLFVIAYLAGGDWLARAFAAYAKLAPSTASNQSSMEALLHDIRQIFLQLGVTRLFSKTLVERLNALPDRPWSRLPSASNQPTVLTEIRLARLLAKLDIQPRHFRLNGQRGKGYELADFAPSTKNGTANVNAEAASNPSVDTTVADPLESSSSLLGNPHI